MIPAWLLLVGCHLLDPGGLPTDLEPLTVTHLAYDIPGYGSWSGEVTGRWNAPLDETYCASSEFVSAGTGTTGLSVVFNEDGQAVGSSENHVLAMRLPELDLLVESIRVIERTEESLSWAADGALLCTYSLECTPVEGTATFTIEGMAYTPVDVDIIRSGDWFDPRDRPGPLHPSVRVIQWPCGE